LIQGETRQINGLAAETCGIRTAPVPRKLGPPARRRSELAAHVVAKQMRRAASSRQRRHVLHHRGSSPPSPPNPLSARERGNARSARSLRQPFGVDRADAIAPIDLFGRLYAFVVLAHRRRQIVHIDVADHRTSLWLVRQILLALARGEQRIAELGRALRNAGDRRTKSGSTPVFR
jgi:hypothetical protein